MEVTKEFLLQRIGGMQEQLGGLLEQEAMVRGAIDDCQTLLRFLETPEPEPPMPPALSIPGNEEPASGEDETEETTPKE